jgi:hypothetical protein
MILILVSWIYIVFTTINTGYLFTRATRIKVNDFAVISVLGLFVITLITSAWAIFGKINYEFHAFLLLLNLITFIKFRNDIGAIYKQLILQLKALHPAVKTFLGIITILILAQCAAPPYVIDNESYYIQTIKWLNEYGLVKGLGNLHFFLAQTSGWHFAQSALNFSFLFKSFNDLSGYCLLLGNVFAIIRLNEYFGNSIKHYLFIGLLPLANVLLFQFISAPSPDMPVYVFSFMIFFYFFESYRKQDTSHFIIIVSLVLFSLYIKTTAAALALIPMILFIKHFKSYFSRFAVLTVLGIIVLALFLVKNIIVSGYPLFPIVSLKYPGLDFSMPKDIAQAYYTFTKRCAYFVGAKDFESMTVYNLFMRWLTLPKLHGLFNKICIAFLIIVPFVIYKKFNRKEAWLLFGVMCVELLMLSVSSPQYRFYLNFILLFGFFTFAMFVYRKKLIITSLYLSLAITTFVVFIPLNLNLFTNNKFILELSTFTPEYSIIPHSNTKSETEFEEMHEGNLRYNSPIENSFLWGAGDGALPCINKKQLNYFERKYGIVPQMRSESLSDGFYSKEVEILLEE